MIVYRTYGLTLESNEPIAGLVAIDALPVDCTIRFGELPPIIDAYCFAYADKTRFVVARDGSAIWCTWETTAEDAATYLLGPILAFVVRLRGALALHASAVLVDDRAIVFAAPPGGGKSTLAAAFARRGHAVLADDVVRLEPGRRAYSPPISAGAPEPADYKSAIP
ncbi:MAG TPA: hypothetical protein VMU84_04675, partial [Thermoanaerobaculia bacterium]|nr:hypothetical protein [Thermoanaerobaculia bacterium]